MATPSAMAKSHEYECDFKFEKLTSPKISGISFSLELKGDENAVVNGDYLANISIWSVDIQQKMIEGNKAQRTHLIKVIAIQYVGLFRKILDDKNSKINTDKIDELRIAYPQVFETLYNDKKLYNLFDVKDIVINNDILKFAISVDLGEPLVLYAVTAFQINNNELKVTSIYFEGDESIDYLFILPVEDFPIFPTNITADGFSTKLSKKNATSSMDITIDYSKSRNFIELRIADPDGWDLQASGNCE